MSRSKAAALSTLTLIFLITACTAQPAVEPTAVPDRQASQATSMPDEAIPNPAIPNPASVYCEEHGGKVDIRTDATGGQVGFCIFPDGSECEEWAYSRGECNPGDSIGKPEAEDRTQKDPADAVAGKEFAGFLWKEYRNEELGYTFQYPAEATIETADNPLKSLTINGPVVAGESWPSLMISHPSDREEYRLPAGSVLETWLVEHNLVPADQGDPVAEARLDDIQIAGTTAVHLRHDRSPQSYAYDKYYFAQAGQIYSIILGHSGDKEDWDVYSYFLESFKFDQ